MISKMMRKRTDERGGVMTRRYSINEYGPDGSLTKLYREPDFESGSEYPFINFVVILGDGAETEDWVKVENYDTKFSSPIVGWLPSWAIGKPLADEPQALDARSLTFSAVRNEATMIAIARNDESLNVVSAEYLMAIFFIENSIDARKIVFDTKTEFAVIQDRSNPDTFGAYSITEEEWGAFIANEGVVLRWENPFIGMLPLPQMRCFSFLTRRDWKRISTSFGGTPINPFVPRKLDLFTSRLIGTAAAIDVAKRERKKVGLDDPVDKVIRDANGWLAGSPQIKNLIKWRADFLTEDNEPVDVKGFLELCRSKLDPALSTAHEMIKHFLPGYIVQPSPTASGWMEKAKAELQEWQDGGWTEHADPGQERAFSYFKETDHGEASITNAATGEITDWCGAFVAYCVAKAGGTVPSGAAASANWQKWGDVSLPTTYGSEVPIGSVVTLAGGENTSQVSHVGFFAGWSEGDKSFNCLSGNQSDKVSIAKFGADRIVTIRTIAGKESQSDDDVIILAKTLYGEILGGSDEQIRNVANVVLNRFLTGYRSGGSIAGTCKSPAQFSCWNAGTSARATLDSLPNSGNQHLDNLKQVALEVIQSRLSQGGDGNLPLEGARHYHNHHVSPDWAIPSRIVLDDGKHIFYKNIA